MHYLRYTILLALILGSFSFSACSPEIHKADNKPKEYEYYHVKKPKTSNDTTQQERKPFGCDSRDLINFSCE